jgi:dihydrofolate synthase/folylpolyglutamate synthase
VLLDSPDAILDRLSVLYPKRIDLSLGRIERLMRALGDPQDALPPVIHVAGTNGKGSTIAYLRAIFEAAGRRAHVYTSPHLVRFNERIRLAGKLIDDAALSRVLAEVEKANAGEPITFFEITTAAAFLAFARHPAEIVLLETGLGGRLDATNLVARPAVSVLTPIAIDHIEFLGPTLASIAAEKAGILKRSVPAAVAPQPDAAAVVFARRAAELGVPLMAHGRDWHVEIGSDGFRYLGRRTLDLPLPSLPGRHQCFNAGLALAALDAAGGFTLDDVAIRQGIAAAEWPARLQRLTAGPLVDRLPHGVALFLDGGHNESAAEVLADWAREGAKPLDLVFGMRSTKSPEDFLRHLAPEVRALRAVGTVGDPAALPPERIVAAAQASGIGDAAPAASVEAAVASLAGQREPARRILICGSLYLAGNVLSRNR